MVLTTFVICPVATHLPGTGGAEEPLLARMVATVLAAAPSASSHVGSMSAMLSTKQEGPALAPWSPRLGCQALLENTFPVALPVRLTPSL